MKIKKSFKLLDLLCYIDDNRKKFKDKKIQFISDSGFNFVGIDSDNDITINFSEGHNNDLTMNNDLFTLDADINIHTHRFDFLKVIYRKFSNKNYRKEIFTGCTIDDVLKYFDNTLYDDIIIIYQNKVIYEYGKVIDHE